MYYYIYKVGNYCLDIYHNCKSKFFFIQDIKTNESLNENKKLILLKLYIFYYFNFLLNYLPIRTRLYLQNIFNNYDNNRIIKIKFSNGKINRNIIYKNISSYNLSKNIKTNYSDENLFNENEIMMMKKKIVLDIFYKDESNNKISIKSIIENYADKNKKYNENKIKNIFLLENISKNKIYLTYLQGIRRQEKEYDLEERDYHVSDIYDF